LLVVAAICGGDVACGEGSDVRGFEHFPQLLDLVDGAFYVHFVSISNKSVVLVKRSAGCLAWVRELCWAGPMVCYLAELRLLWAEAGFHLLWAGWHD